MKNVVLLSLLFIILSCKKDDFDRELFYKREIAGSEYITIEIPVSPIVNALYLLRTENVICTPHAVFPSGSSELGNIETFEPTNLEFNLTDYGKKDATHIRLAFKTVVGEYYEIELTRVK